MKVLHLNETDIYGGAGRAAYRLHKSLLGIGVESNMLVQKKLSGDYTVYGPKKNSTKLFSLFKSRIDKLPVRLRGHHIVTPFSPSFLPSNNLLKRIKKIDPDIIHLHWICGGMIRIEELSKIKIPIVWSMHDNWPFTGGCHIKWDCMKFKDICNACPVLESKKFKDLSNKVYNRKKRTYAKIERMTFIGLSKWMAEEAKKSSLLKNHSIINLPNPIDTSLFKKIDKNIAREVLNLPKNAKIVLFGAMDALSDINKGYKELTGALKLVKDKNIELAIFGANKPQNPDFLSFKTNYFNKLNDDYSLILLYNAADVLIVPSLQENLSNVIMESLACGTPVVAFDTGGNSDLIKHKQNGYLSNSFSIKDLANGISWSLREENADKISRKAISSVRNTFHSELISQKYKSLYESLI